MPAFESDMAGTHAAAANRVAWAVLWIATALLAFELVATRLFSVILWNHFAFLAISIALFGLGVAGLAVYLLPEVFSPARALRQMRIAALALPIVLWIVVGVLCALPIRMNFNREMFVYLTVIFLVAAVPFVVGGLAIALALTHWPGRVNRIYAFDLVGSACGCGLVIVLLHWLDGPSAALALGVLPLVAALWLRRSWAVSALLACAIAATAINASTNWIRVRIARSNVQGPMLYERWNAFSRVSVFVSLPWRGWWVRPDTAEPAISALGIQIDGEAFTPLLQYRGDLQAVRVVLSDIANVAYHVRPHTERALVIGAGGGKDVLAALVAGTQRVRAVELNPLIALDVVSDRFRDFSGDLYHLPQVELVVGEGRTVLRHDSNHYNVIQISMVDTSAASAAGAYALTENSLYTLEAAQEFLRHLQPGGIVTNTWINFPNLEGGNRLVALYAEALRREGFPRVETRLAVLASPLPHLTVLACPDGFSPGEVQALRTLATRLGFTALYLPGDPLDGAGASNDVAVIRKLVSGVDLPTFFDDYRLDLRPVTDDRPFFFYQQRFRDTWWALTHWNVGYLFGNGLFVIVKLLVISAGAVGLFLFGPLLLARRLPAPSAPGRASLALYFLCLGIGFIVLEITLVQMLGYYLGHPLLGLGVTLSTLLLCCGLGSWWSGRWPVAHTPRRLQIALAIVVGMGLIYSVALPAAMRLTLATPLATRVTLVVLLIAPLGFALGIPFPSGLRLLADDFQLVPWMWAINAGATVFGSALATMIVMHLGFALTLRVGALVYAAALVLVWLASPRTTATDASPRLAS